MSRIKSENTGLELAFFRMLRKWIKPGFRRHVRALRGKPDVVFPDQRVCVFVDGDFWHGWQYPRWKHRMKNNFWRDKIESNRKRDSRTHVYLRSKGWIVLRFWEHEIRTKPMEVVKRIKALPGF